ncbi:MAG: methylmalonyl-CoA mutase family protein, partial [Thermodesulfobacteriota bacterium]|nr:methylmalonyl-CoA mutase family protein [Thermodesulfobacteriota bacterium]
VKVGMNKYRMEDIPRVNVYRRPPEAEDAAIKGVKTYKNNRDNKKTEDALKNVREAAEGIDKEWPKSCGLLMPALVDAARKGATVGEMHHILRDVFGYGYYAG